jgi:hypothetical protein
MRRSVGALLVVLSIVACAPTPSSSPTSRPATPSPAAAALSVTGSGVLCAPWWYGCGAYLVVEPGGWTLPSDWARDAADIGFSGRITKRDAIRVTGAEQAGNDRIDPGRYAFVVVLTSQPEGVSPQPAMSASMGCSVDVNVPPGARAVSVDVRFEGGCTIEVSIDEGTATPSY